MLGWEPERIVVENKLVGGGFGGKEDMSGKALVRHFDELFRLLHRLPVPGGNQGNGVPQIVGQAANGDQRILVVLQMPDFILPRNILRRQHGSAASASPAWSCAARRCWTGTRTPQSRRSGTPCATTTAAVPAGRAGRQ